MACHLRDHLTGNRVRRRKQFVDSEVARPAVIYGGFYTHLRSSNTAILTRPIAQSQHTAESSLVYDAQ